MPKASVCRCVGCLGYRICARSHDEALARGDRLDHDTYILQRLWQVFGGVPVRSGQVRHPEHGRMSSSRGKCCSRRAPIRAASFRHVVVVCSSLIRAFVWPRHSGCASLGVHAVGHADLQGYARTIVVSGLRLRVYSLRSLCICSNARQGRTPRYALMSVRWDGFSSWGMGGCTS